MAKSELIARQSAHPTGFLGHLVARVMALDTAAANRSVLAALEPKPGERVLELGCGHGRTLRRVAKQVASACGLAVGVDPSAVMRDVAQRHLRAAIAAGTARVEDGDCSAIPEPDASFDKLFSVHTIYFWPNLDAGLAEIHRVLRRGGELLLASHSSENEVVAAELPTSVYTLRGDDELTAALARAHFRDVTITADPRTQLRFAQATA